MESGDRYQEVRANCTGELGFCSVQSGRFKLTGTRLKISHPLCPPFQILSAYQAASHPMPAEEGVYASEETLHSSLAFLQDTLAAMGLCEAPINLASTEPADVVATCNTIYGLLQQHQRDARFKDQLKQGACRRGGGQGRHSSRAGIVALFMSIHTN